MKCGPHYPQEIPAISITILKGYGRFGESVFTMHSDDPGGFELAAKGFIRNEASKVPNSSLIFCAERKSKDERTSDGNGVGG
jgi:hypothetical protein